MRPFWNLLSLWALIACPYAPAEAQLAHKRIIWVALGGQTEAVLDSGPPASEFFAETTFTHLPVAHPKGLSMDARPGDMDGDGDLDLVIANEFRPNILLLNDGQGRFADPAADRLPQTKRDSEDVGIATWTGTATRIS